MPLQLRCSVHSNDLSKVVKIIIFNFLKKVQKIMWKLQNSNFPLLILVGYSEMGIIKGIKCDCEKF